MRQSALSARLPARLLCRLPALAGRALAPLGRHLARALPRALPYSCALCGLDGGAAVCEPCCARYLPAPHTRCRQCALPLAGATHCGACLRRAPPFDRTIVVCDYAAPLDQLVLGLKFGHRLALAPWCAQQLARAVHEAQEAQDADWTRPDLLCVVPLGPRRLAARGFNQALEIARPLARELAVPLAPRVLVRTRETPAQAQLTPDERARNIRGAFSPAPQTAATIRGKHIAVVDDVMTTGQTLAEIAAMLKRFGAARVSNLVFARTPAPPN